MIKVSVLYANADDATFDIDYYRDTHMAIVQRTMNPSRIEIDHGDDGPYLAMGHLYFDSPEHHAEAMGNMGEAAADVPNFTNVAPVVQTSRPVDR